MAGGAGPDRAALNSRGVLTLPFQTAKLPEGSATGRGTDHTDPCPNDIPGHTPGCDPRCRCLLPGVDAGPGRAPLLSRLNQQQLGWGPGSVSEWGEGLEGL